MEHQSAKESSGPIGLPQGNKTPNSTDIAALSTPVIHDVKRNTSNIVPISECRRSSRKKIIKFDVRDLLNKNRKPHKIQIEARIDSNVPNTSKACPSAARGVAAFTAPGLNAISSQDLSSKQKAFMEKSAIFRRFSISQDQSKPPPPPPIPLPPTILSKVGDKNNDKLSVNVTGKRINRSQEYYKNALLKPMPTTSLIVAQVESNVRTVEIKVPTKQTADATTTQTYSPQPEPLPQKKRGRPPKIRVNELEKKSTNLANKVQERTLSPEKAKNWTEYKACLAEQNTIKHESIPDNMTYTKIETKQALISSASVTVNKNVSKASDITEQPLAPNALKSNENRDQPDLVSISEDQFRPLNTSIGQPSTSFGSIEKAKDFPEKPITSTCEQSISSPQKPAKVSATDKVFDESKERPIVNLCKNEQHEEFKEPDGGSISKETNLIAHNAADVCTNTSTSSATSNASFTKYKSELFHQTLCNKIPETTLHKNIISSPDQESQNIKESNRTKRPQKQTKDTQRRQKAVKAIEVSFVSTGNINKDYAKSSNDNTSTKHIGSISPTSEKLNDTSTENSSSDSFLVTEILEMKEKAENDVNSETKRDSQQRKSLRKRKTGTNKNKKGDIESNKELVERKCDEKVTDNLPKFAESLNQSPRIESCDKVALTKTIAQRKSKEQSIGSIEESSNNRETNKLKEIDVCAKIISNELLTAKDEAQTSNVRKSLRKQKDSDPSISRTAITVENYPAESENKATKQTISNRKSKEKSKPTPMHDLECAVPSNLPQANGGANDRDLSKTCTHNISLEIDNENKDMSQRKANDGEKDRDLSKTCTQNISLEIGNENKDMSQRKANDGEKDRDLSKTCTQNISLEIGNENKDMSQRKANDGEKGRDLSKTCTQNMSLEIDNENKDMSQQAADTGHEINPIEEVSSLALSNDQLRETQETISLNQILTFNEPAKGQKDKCEQLSYEESRHQIENKQVNLLDHAVDTNLALADQISREENETECEGIISEIKSSENPVIDDTDVAQAEKADVAQAEKVVAPNEDSVSKQTLQNSQFQDGEHIDINTSPKQNKTFSHDDRENEIVIVKEHFTDHSIASRLLKDIDAKQMSSEECSTSAVLLHELEERKQLNELPIGKPAEMCYQQAGHSLNADKPKPEKRTSLRKQKESIVFPNKNNETDHSADDTNNKLSSSSNKSDEGSSLENIKTDDEFVSNDLFNRSESSIVVALPPVSEPSETSDNVPDVTKKRGRKRRFKNLHLSGLDYGDKPTNFKDADTSFLSMENKGYITPDLHSKCEENVISLNENLPKGDTTFNDDNNSEIDKAVTEPSTDRQNDDENVTNTEKPDQVTRKLTEESHNTDLPPDPDSTKSYVIKNLSIETNTLLDILRTVQSNEAAVEAKKECDTVVAEANDLDVSPGSSSARKMSIQQNLIESNSGSPSRSTSISPLNTCRSDSSTPPVLKKSNTSPSRSNTSSPMCSSKKTTRRYERRARRGDDPTHKTLEETFAEIAALSSKAVLEMSNIDRNFNEGETVPEVINMNTKKENDEFPESSTMQVNVQGVDEAQSEQKSNESTSQTFQGDVCLSDSTPSTSYSQATEYQAFEKCNKTTKPFECSEVSTTNTEKPNDKNNDSKDLIVDHLNFKKNYSQDEKQSDRSYDSTSDLLTKQVEGENTSQQMSDPCDVDNNIKTKTIDVECFTPKSSPSKKDLTQNNKAESKSSNKKSSKKTKNSECVESSEMTADNISSSATTITPPPKRGRKPKTPVQSDTPLLSPASSSGGKKKSRKEQKLEEKEEVAKSNEIPDDSDEKIAKKKRQKKLREAFEAALNDQAVSFYDTPSSSPTFDSSTNSSKSRHHSESDLEIKNNANTSDNVAQAAVTEPEEDPDPLKDIEKFIEDGVNLLKKDYKIDDDSVDNVIITNTNLDESDKTPTAQEHESLSTKESININFETPADTPITTPSVTPSVTPPPKSPESSYQSEEHSSGGIRRSHRIKLITKTPKALVGRGLVRDKERFSIKDDVETKSHYTLDDHLLDLAEVEAKNAKFLKEMEERLSNFQVIKDNEYKCERVISKEARKMICDCFLTAEEEVRGELGCGEDCLNRLLMIECGPECNVRERCTNKRFQKLLCSPCRVFRTEKKGFGIMADIEILPGEFIMEYVGEVIDTEEFEKRRIAYSQDKNRHYYFMALRSDAIIDATIKGNISRFINHSCDPNAETQKWTVNGELRIGFFSRKSIMPGEEITFNYQYQRYGREAQRCYCESANCRGWIGQEPNSDEGEQIDDDEDETDEDDEDEENSNLLEDDADSDSSVSDPEEVQKKLELAAAQAAAELAPISMDDAAKRDENSGKEKAESTRSETEEEDSKSKFKKLLSKMAEKVAAKHKQTKKEQKLQRKKKSKESSAETGNKQRFLEDPDIEGEVASLSRSGLKNQSHTLRLSRLMVRAKLVQTRLNLLDILRKGELPCRRLFLDYHGLRLVHGWMSEDAGNMQIRLALLLTLELLPIANKSMLTETKVMQVVRSWCDAKEALSPNEDSLSSNSNSQDCTLQQSSNNKATIDESTIPERAQLQKLACKLVSTWDNLPEIFRIPKKERIEQMKEHEREADRQYAETEESRDSPSDIDRSSRFVKRVNTTSRFSKPHCSKQLQPTTNLMRIGNMTPENANNISKAQRREMFAAKVARDEAEKRMAEERREYETKCRFFGLDPKKTRPQDIPFYVNSDTGQWYSVERKPIATPPSYAHFPVPENYYSTNPEDYHLPPVCATLPPQWKYAITPQGLIYYYHVQYRVPQWEPPSASQLHECEIKIEEEDSGNENTPTTAPDSSDEDDDILLGLDAAQLKAYIDRKVEARRQQRYQRLVDQRAISPRREEDRVYNQMEVRKYKENKEKIRKRKEDIRRKRAESSRQSTLNMCTLGGLTESNPSASKAYENEDGDGEGVVPIQDYLLSSDEDEDIKIEINIPLIDKIVEGDKIVDELDALTSHRSFKRILPPHREINDLPLISSPSVSSAPAAVDRQEHKKRKLEKKEKRKPKEQDAKYRKTKENFRCEIAGIIVHHLKPYRKDTCTRGRIQSNEDFNHLARKLTHFVMIKELKYCESVGQTLVVTESVKNKSREFIKKYMAKYGEFYVKSSNDPDFKDIPFAL